MRCPRLDELPAPPPGRTGWPWTEASPDLPERQADGRPWPRISIVTPSYNQAAFLEETIRSVLLQGYPDLEYVVIDGGSRDGSVEIIEKYSPWLAHWTSEPDRGQSHAINKGFQRTTGVILAWLNSDDIYYAGALGAAAQAMTATGCDILIGAMDKVEASGQTIRFVKRCSPRAGRRLHTFPVLARGPQADFHLLQPPMFWRRALWERTGGLDERYHHVMDLEWCSRALACGATVATTDDLLARFLLHPGSKTHDLHDRHLEERVRMYLRLGRTPGFRRLPCLLAALEPARRILARRAHRRLAEGRRLTAFLLRTASFAIRGLDFAAARLRSDQHGHPLAHRS